MYGLIMAGGRGTRFWPVSRKAHPKQILKLIGNKSMIQVTIERLKKVIAPENFYIITSKNLTEPIKKELRKVVPSKNIIGEPEGKNTLPCLALTVSMLYKNEPDSVLGVFPGDHNIKKENKFLEILKKSEKLVKYNDVIVTIGIKPTYPATGYGYIEYDLRKKKNGFFKVNRFCEKPNKKKAGYFLKKGNFLWNGGMLISKVSTLVEAFRKYSVQTYKSALKLSSKSGRRSFQGILKQEYSKMESISIDYAILEKADNLVTIPASIGWSDIGAWTGLADLKKKDRNGNIVIGEYENIESTNNIIHTKDKLTALVGVHDLIVVDTDDAILICSKNEEQKVSAMVKLLEKKGYGNLL